MAKILKTTPRIQLWSIVFGIFLFLDIDSNTRIFLTYKCENKTNFRPTLKILFSETIIVKSKKKPTQKLGISMKYIDNWGQLFFRFISYIFRKPISYLPLKIFEIVKFRIPSSCYCRTFSTKTVKITKFIKFFF